ncbi:uncharacterized protein LOC129235222 [Uloborus diversus]|uniref:uncharacterized protein LOC129235222 n=1 Tax=Uloborus diversus TaxID=327109 RepID=UPI00240A4B7C|nr:uncharacterized protein LOC129235222 [Uloborus diversus]
MSYPAGIEDNGSSSNKLESETPKLELLPPSLASSQPAIWGRSVGFRNNGVAPAKKQKVVAYQQQEEEFQPEEYEDIEEAVSLSSPDTGEDCDAFGRNVAAQLKLMNHMQKCLAQRLMGEILFRGQMQILQMNTTLATQALTYHQPQQQQQPPQHGTFYPPRNATPGFNRDLIHQQVTRSQSQQQ